jgi:L,D-peptidoglycan transpeptidase YkuD (ErfK/YbiS/YcfS/YnhG family)
MLGKWSALLWLLAATALATGCAAPGGTANAAPDAGGAASRQLVLVTTPGWDATQGELRTFEREAGAAWREIETAVPITVGRSGSAWGRGLHPAQSAGPQKQEGDGRAPAGIFAIGTGFGYASSAATALPYAPMQATSWCMDVVDSPLYNQIVDAREVGEAAVQGSSEPMRLDLHNKGDQRYATGFVIQHNTQAIKGAGSCIFAHLWGKPGQPTAGCTAMAPESMRRLYGWLKPDAHPQFVLLPQTEYQRLRTQWKLP